MIDIPFATANIIACMVAIVFAAHTGEGRRIAVVLACLLLINVVVCGLVWTPYSPKFALNAIGIPADSKNIWEYTDWLYGVIVITIGYRYWWSWLLWTAVVAQEITHGLYRLDLFSGDYYTDRLDNLLWLQMTVFLFIGGRGVGDILYRFLDRVRSLGGIPAQARARAGSRTVAQKRG